MGHINPARGDKLVAVFCIGLLLIACGIACPALPFIQQALCGACK